MRCFFLFFFFKQKTAYEIGTGDWSSDVCSSDLSLGDEQDIIVRNPCGFPIEFYSLESDKQYLEEEKILRLMKGWDEYNTIDRKSVV